MRIGGSEKRTGLERMAVVGRAMLWTLDLAWDIGSFWDGIDCDNDDEKVTKKKIPEKRDTQ